MDLGTWLYTLMNGKKVGVDEFGNKYYCNKAKALHGRERRWVMYGGDIDASRIPPEWHAWLHHTTSEPLTENAAQAHPWQKDHVANMTGTANAYRPRGHNYKGGKRAAATGDYEAWTPAD